MSQFRAEVDFHTRGKVYGRKEMPENDVLVWNTGKKYGTPSGTWQMTLSTRTDADGKTWFDKLNAQDFVRIRLAIGDGPFITVMNGLINRVFRNTTVNPGTGQVSETITLAGLDLSKVLTKFNIWFNPEKGGLEGIIASAALLTTDAFKNLSVENALKALLDLVFNRTDSKFVSDFLAVAGNNALGVFVDLGNDGLPPIWELLKLHASVGAVSSDTYILNTFDGSIWNGLRRWANEPWNELFVDNGHPDNVADTAGDGGKQSLLEDPDTTNIYLRPVPFKKERFERLVIHDLSYADIQSPFSVSKGDDDTYTCYFAYPVFQLGLSTIEAKALSGGTRIIQEKGTSEQTTRPSGEPTTSFANRFGFRKLDVKSIYLGYGHNDEDKAELQESEEFRHDLTEELTKDLVDFFDPNPTFLQGSVKIKPNRARTLIKVGQRVRIAENPKGRPDEIYYVVGVTNDWQFSGTFTQTLSLQRGVVAPG